MLLGETELDPEVSWWESADSLFIYLFNFFGDTFISILLSHCGKWMTIWRGFLLQLRYLYKVKHYIKSLFIVLVKGAFNLNVLCLHVNASYHARSLGCFLFQTGCFEDERDSDIGKETCRRNWLKNRSSCGGCLIQTSHCQSFGWTDRSPDDNSFSGDVFPCGCQSQSHESNDIPRGKGNEETLIIKKCLAPVCFLTISHCSPCCYARYMGLGETFALCYNLFKYEISSTS